MEPMPLPQLSHDSIRALMRSTYIPEPTQITTISTVGWYHSIYMLTFPLHSIAGLRSQTSTELVLRVSGTDLPSIKTENEAAILTWVAQSTSVPVPAVVRYDISCDNPIGHEYILLERAPGVPLDRLFRTFDEEKLTVVVVDAMVDLYVQLAASERQWTHIGGLRFGQDGKKIVPGPIVEWAMWNVPEIEKYWPEGTRIEDVNIAGPYASYVEYITALVRTYIYAIKIHPSLAHMRDLLPRIDAFLDALARNADTLNQTTLSLAHQDVHFGNMLYDETIGQITFIDWEFSGVVPEPSQYPVMALGWTRDQSEEDKKVNLWVRETFARRCSERGVAVMDNSGFSSEAQEHMHEAVSSLLSIVKLCPTDGKQDKVEEWRGAVLEHMGYFEMGTI
ncbi:hypothetical protein FIBSPDRAFT_861363 [Athelia psychrophila]|uniref:Aminoglycoside phosphotransferase domain-containing protein n=1 Tax=Athelia psychrophila TaxID=1759441 RepID=A0A166J931_9AGAM|nr:hypothetical protein FIBSPDRAFT_861363 [Fibularhizoctonia sp. CBS 109695]